MYTHSNGSMKGELGSGALTDLPKRDFRLNKTNTQDYFSHNVAHDVHLFNRVYVCVQCCETQGDAIIRHGFNKRAHHPGAHHTNISKSIKMKLSPQMNSSWISPSRIFRIFCNPVGKRAHVKMATKHTTWQVL
jgi:hypothetical protein